MKNLPELIACYEEMDVYARERLRDLARLYARDRPAKKSTQRPALRLVANGRNYLGGSSCDAFSHEHNVSATGGGCLGIDAE